MNYELLLTREAELEVGRTVDYIAKRSPRGAAAWSEQLEQALAEVKRNPIQFGSAPESAEHDVEIRQFLFKTRRGRMYRALFTVVGRGIYVIHLRGPSQNVLLRDQLRR